MSSTGNVCKLVAVTLAVAALNYLAFLVFLPLWNENPSWILVPLSVAAVTLALYFAFLYLVFFRSIGSFAREEREGAGPRALPEEISASLRAYLDEGHHLFSESVMSLEAQLVSLAEKKRLIRASLLERFQPTELSFRKFTAVVDGVEDFTRSNAKGVLARLRGFDEKEYERILVDGERGAADSPREERAAILAEYQAQARKAVAIGNEVLVKLDKLQLEILRLSTYEEKDFEKIESTRELDDLVKNMKWYR
ncbi:MAG: hypothetical protein LBO66_04880 [Deltaproteobacteria bacterium]|jgi:hypothetical protein|nr:hypothetical protein [Deltaproteobacteria bacterium]